MCFGGIVGRRQIGLLFVETNAGFARPIRRL
jgi:hypothetical protein